MKNSKNGTLTAIDLFCGAGGLTVGLKRAGFKVISAIELDKAAAETYSFNHPEVLLWNNDIRTLSPSEIIKKLGIAPGDLDLLAGCPPCQGFSSIRTKNGALQIDDVRNDLVIEFALYVEAFRPKAILLENVPGLANDQRFSQLIHRLTELGYPCEGAYSILDAVEFGVPQRRKRLVLTTSLYGVIPKPAAVQKKKTVGDALKNLPPAGKSGDYLHDLPDKRSHRVLEIIKAVPKDGGSRKDLSAELQLECHRRVKGFNDVYGRMSWSKPSPTITSGCNNPSKGRFIHPEEDRAITLREAALLQTFPKNYKFSMMRGKTGVALMIGNALPPELIRRHAKQIALVVQAANPN